MENRVYEMTFTVTEEKTARVLGSGDLPVLGTPAMIAAKFSAGIAALIVGHFAAKTKK